MAASNVLEQMESGGLFWGEATVQALRSSGGVGGMVWHWEQLYRTAVLVLCPSQATGWAPELPGFSGQAYSTVGLGTILSSWWGCELVSLPWQSTRMGPWTCLAHYFEIWIMYTCTWSILVRQGPGVVLQTWKAMNCAFCVSPTVSKAFGWTMQLLVCFGKVCSDRLKIVCSGKMVYELVSLPTAVGGGGPKPLKVFVVLSWPMSLVPVTTLALLWGWSA